jgi:hypothetical protein
MSMESHDGIAIKPSDLYYKYRRKKEMWDISKFAGTPDPHPFDRDDLYEVIPMLEAVMNELGSVDGRVLNRLEEVMVHEMPTFIMTREEVFDCLVGVMRDLLDS